MCRCHLLLVILLLLLLPNSTVFAFYSSDVKESIGGLITDAQVCEERRRIDKETIPQIKNELTVSNYSTLRIACPTANLTFTQNTTGYQSLVCNLTYQTDTPLAVSFDTDVHQIASLAEPFWIYLAPGSSVMTLTMPIRRTQMGSTYLKIWVRQAKPGRQSESLHTWDRYNATLVAQYTDWLVNGTAAYEAGSPSVMGFHLKVLRARGLLEVIFRIVVAVLVCGLTLLMGCELDALLIWRHLKKPVAPLIGFLCQFGLMPTIAFGIASVVPIKAEFGFGLLTTGCCPGGGGSNIWTLLLHGDLNLSMTMTFVSSVFALGMMPLMIFIYGRFFIDGGAIKIPYLEIAGQLCYIVVPVLIGMFIKWKWRACGTRAARLLQPLAFAFLVTIIGFGTYVNLPIYRLMGEYPLLFPTAAALPWIGFLLSGFFAFICRRTRAEILTIAIETGIQNIGIAMLVLLYSMPQPEGDIGAVMPLVVSLFTPIPLIIAYIGLLIKEGKCTRCCKKPNSREDKASEEQGEPLRPADNDVEVADADVNSDDTRKLSYSKDHIIQTIIS